MQLRNRHIVHRSIPGHGEYEAEGIPAFLKPLPQGQTSMQKRLSRSSAPLIPSFMLKCPGVFPRVTYARSLASKPHIKVVS